MVAIGLWVLWAFTDLINLAPGRLRHARRVSPFSIVATAVDIRCGNRYRHRIMPRTTLDIDPLLLKHLKELQKTEGRSLGKIVSHLLAEALARRKTAPKPPKLHWTAHPMRALVDLSDLP